MRKVRNESGARLFLGSDVLSPQQVAGFSLVWLLRSGRVHRSNMKNLTATMKITRMQLRRSLYIQSYMQWSKRKLLCGTLLLHFLATFAIWCTIITLSTLPVAMLREICESLGLNVDDITERKKKPLINRITGVVGECLCRRN